MSYSQFQLIRKKILVFRDDLYPFLGGGNKGRKMDYISKDIFLKGANSIVTTGGIQSNHCRAVAVFAAMNGMKCSLVLHGSEEQFYKQSGNAKIMRLSGAKLIFVNNAAEIGPTMDSEMNYYTQNDYIPYYLRGGGHIMEGGFAYIEAIKELKEYCSQNEWYPKYIFLASGTGSTQAGILAGLDKYGLNDIHTIGISVARERWYAESIVNNFYIDLCSNYNIKCTNREVVVLDDYICGGYGMFNDEIKIISDNSVKSYGFTLDTCYTGKAFYGMLDYIQKNNIENKNILFWHTGGIFNFLAE